MQPGYLTKRGYGRHRGVHHHAVTRAVESGRLRESVFRDEQGRVWITDAALADREWAANTDLTEAPMAVRERAEARAKTVAPEPVAQPVAQPPDAPPTAVKTMTTSESNAVTAYWKALHAEMDYRKEAGELIEAASVKHELAGYIAHCKTRLLGIPSRAKQALPTLSVVDLGTIEALIREALEELAA